MAETEEKGFLVRPLRSPEDARYVVQEGGNALLAVAMLVVAVRITEATFYLREQPIGIAGAVGILVAGSGVVRGASGSFASASPCTTDGPTV